MPVGIAPVLCICIVLCALLFHLIVIIINIKCFFFVNGPMSTQYDEYRPVDKNFPSGRPTSFIMHSRLLEINGVTSPPLASPLLLLLD